ncbi:MAG TPA: hypothetical protein VFS48_09185 [Solirubrobacterales bacterium]|nr:hypothetical protein [Solirubrobacterales bacterium]
MRPLSPPPLAVALAGVALVLTGCESTQDKSAKIAAELGPVAQEKGLSISERSKDVKVIDTTLFSDANGSAVVVELHNDAKSDLAEVPILIDVRDAKGRSVYRNDIPGIEPALAAVPFIPAGGDVIWIHDQVLATGEPAKVEATVGAGGEAVSGPVPEVSVSEPRLEGDPYTGVAAGGEVVNESGEDIERLLLYAVARQGDRIVAAGRGAIEPLKDKPEPVPYNVFFIGNPQGAEVTVTEFPATAGRVAG